MSSPSPGRLGGLPYLSYSWRLLQLPLSVKTCTSVTQMGVLWQTIIHTVFILSAIGIAWTDRLMHVAAGTTKLATWRGGLDLDLERGRPSMDAPPYGKCAAWAA